jgi:hypothetical protein
MAMQNEWKNDFIFLVQYIKHSRRDSPSDDLLEIIYLNHVKKLDKLSAVADIVGATDCPTGTEQGRSSSQQRT